MTYEQGVRIGCRLFVLYLLFWVVSDLIGLPREVVTFRHELQAASQPDDLSARGRESVVYFLRDSALVLVDNVLRLAVWCFAALYFYQCGPRIKGSSA
jgi:hypothetical protein